MRLKIYPAAKRAVKEIWGYTRRTWGEEQADAYVHGLYDAAVRLAKDKSRWRRAEHKDVHGIFFARYEHHYIFFRHLSDGGLGIVSILHEKMDIPHRLKGDLDGD